MNDLPNGPDTQNNPRPPVGVPDMLTEMPQPPQRVQQAMQAPPAVEQMAQAAPANPLLNYYRQPKIYVKLPSRGRFYPPGDLDSSETGDYAVFAMTAKDELMFKTPDALMNGQSTVEVIRSCIPAIKNPWNMPSIDLDTVLIAIRVATYGDKMTVSTICPECREENDYEVNLVNFLENIGQFRYQDVIDCNPLKIYIKPYTYKEVTKTAIKALEQERIFDIINDDEMSDEEKIDKFGESFVRLTNLTVDIVTNSIIKISTPEGDVTNIGMIQAFINNAPREVFQAIKDHVDKLKENIEFKSQQVKCAHCDHEFETQIQMDQANFFAVKS